jgi:F-box-like
VNTLLPIHPHRNVLNAWKFIKQKVKKTTPRKIPDLPEDIILHILKFLKTPKDLCRTSLVCKNWEKLASNQYLWDAFDLENLFPSKLKFLDKKAWKTYADLTALKLDLSDDAPAIDNRIAIPFFTKLFASFGYPDITLLTLPKGLTLKKVIQLAKTPKQGNSTNVTVWPSTLEKVGDIALNKTSIVAITNVSVKERKYASFEDSKYLSFEAQQELLNTNGCEMPDVLSIVTLVVLTHISSNAYCPTRLFDNDNGAHRYTRCSIDEIGTRIVAGGFTNGNPDGLIVRPATTFRHPDWEDFHIYGVAAMWRF